MSESDPVPAALAVGQLFAGRYEVVRRLKSGGMGVVYEVLDQKTNRRRALKIMLPGIVADPEARSRFRHEATITANVESEHLVETFDAGVEDATQTPFLVMELLRGEDLSRVLEARGRLAPAEVVTVLSQVAVALDKTHAESIIHRDLKPENLFWTRRDDGTPRIKILDFGIAKIVERSTRGSTTRVVGTPLYMAPEQMSGEGNLDARADLYALAHIAFTLLVGSAYWEGELRESETLYAFIVKVMAGHREPASVRSAASQVALSPGFDAWFARGAAVDRAARFDDAGTMVHALADALEVEVHASSLALAGLAATQHSPGEPRRSAGSVPAPGEGVQVRVRASRSDGDHASGNTIGNTIGAISSDPARGRGARRSVWTVVLVACAFGAAVAFAVVSGWLDARPVALPSTAAAAGDTTPATPATKTSDTAATSVPFAASPPTAPASVATASPDGEPKAAAPTRPAARATGAPPSSARSTPQAPAPPPPAEPRDPLNDL